MAILVTIAGVERPEVQISSIRISYRLDTRGTAEFMLIRTAGSYRPEVGQPVQIFGAVGFNNVVFGGTIDQIEEQMLRSGTELRFHCLCVDYNQLASRFITRGYYENTKAGDIVKLLRTTAPMNDTTLAAEGVTAADIQDGPLVTVVFDSISLADALDELAALAGFRWWIDPKKGLHFAPPGAVAADFEISDAAPTNCVRDSFTRTQTRERLANFVVIRFNDKAKAPEFDIPTPPPDGILKEFATFFPIKQMLSIFLNHLGVSSVQTFDLKPEADHPGSQWYYKNGEAKITQAAAEPALVAGDELTLKYDAYFQDTLFVKDAASIAARAAVEGGSGQYGFIEDHTDLMDTADASAIGDAVLAELKALGDRIRFITDKTGPPGGAFGVPLQPGQLLTVSLAAHGLSGATYLIDEVTGEYVPGSPTITIDNIVVTLPFGFFRWTVTAGAVLNYVAYFKQLIARGGGISAGPSGGVVIGPAGNMVLKSVLLTANGQAIANPTEGVGTVLLYRVKQGPAAPADGYTAPAWGSAFTNGMPAPAAPWPGAGKVSWYPVIVQEVSAGVATLVEPWTSAVPGINP